MKPLEDKLWTVANAVTAFAVLQCVAFLYAAAQGSLKITISTSLFTKTALCIISVGCSAIYAFAVWRCYRMALRLHVEREDIWRETTRGRILAIIFFDLLATLSLILLPYVLDPAK